VDSTSGLRRIVLEKRIREAQIPDEAGRVDLLALFSNGGNVIKGKVKFENGILSNGSTDNLLIEFPYVAPPNMIIRLLSAPRRMGNSCRFNPEADTNSPGEWKASGPGSKSSTAESTVASRAGQRTNGWWPASGILHC